MWDVLGLSGGCLEGVSDVCLEWFWVCLGCVLSMSGGIWEMSGGCLEGVWEDVWGISRGMSGGMSRMSGGCLEDFWGQGCLNGVWIASPSSYPCQSVSG